MESTRPTWNDQRMDEFAGRTEENFREIRNEIRVTRTALRNELRDEIREVHSEIQGVRTELKDDIGGLRGEMNGRFAKLEDKIDQRFNILFGALATGFVAAVAQRFLG